MKNAILVPTDFSENAWIATQYAAKLAEKFNWDITYYMSIKPLEDCVPLKNLMMK